MKLDILAFGVHPDDVELSCGGALIAEKERGKKVGIVDLTKGELGTRGTAVTRKREASEAARIMGMDVRENLSMADGFFKNDKEHQLRVIAAIRKYKPEVVFCNAPDDRHPDHGRSSKLVYDASFLSGLVKIGTKEKNKTQEAWRPKYLFHYIQDRYIKPNFVIDITAVFEKKIEAVRAYKTQFYDPRSKEPETYISSPEFLESIIYRAKMMGKMIGVKYGEGFVADKMIGIKGIDSLVIKNT